MPQGAAQEIAMNIREKIAKIIEKAKSTDSEAEAEMLLAKATQMMEAHQIEAHELGDASDPISVALGVVAQPGPPMYKYDVYRALANYYGCKTFRAHAGFKGKSPLYQMQVTGPLSAQVTAELMGEYVWDQLCTLARKQAKEHGVSASAQLRKLSNALCSRVWGEIHAREKAAPRTTVAGKNALVVKDAVQAFYDNHYAKINMTTIGAKSRSSNAAARAGAAGVSLHRQTGGSSTLRIGK